MPLIKIKTANKGRLRRIEKTKPGKKIPVAKLKATVAKAKKSGNIKEDREAVFAENRRKCNHSGSKGRGLLGV